MKPIGTAAIQPDSSRFKVAEFCVLLTLAIQMRSPLGRGGWEAQGSETQRHNKRRKDRVADPKPTIKVETS